ncbi:uncharacterized protein [Setaria viridis]|nr:uncharacterized protein LOC117851342 [Setaria viridis]
MQHSNRRRVAWEVGSSQGGGMDRILGLSLIGTGPGNVFGPGMSAGVLESFARGKAEEGNGRGAAGGTGSAAAWSGGKIAAERASEAETKGAGGQERRGGEAEARFYPAFDGVLCFDAVAPYWHA